MVARGEIVRRRWYTKSQYGEILMPIKQDGRKNNGGHKNAGRKPMKNPKRTGSMRLSDDDWSWLDDPANGKSRGEIVRRFIDEKRRIAPMENEVKKT